MAEEAAVSLHDELSTQFDAVESPTPEVTDAAPVVADAPVDAAPVVDTPAPVDTRARDEFGRFAPKKEGEPVPDAPAQASEPAPEAPQVAPDAIQPAGPDLPPSTWTAAAKALYKDLPPVLKGEIKKRETDFQRGIAQYKQAADYGHTLNNVIEPFRAMITSEGSDPVRTVQNLLSTAYRLRSGSPTERGQMIMGLVQQFGADISPWIGQQQAAPADAAGVNPQSIQHYVDQLVNQRLQPYNQFQQQLATQQQQSEHAAAEATRSQIEQFRLAAAPDGTPKYVYFDNVRPLMASLIENGNASSLEQAYEMACRADPEVSAARAAEQQRSEAAKRLEEARKKAEDARRASAVNVTGQGGVGIADSTKTTLRDELMARMDGSALV